MMPAAFWSFFGPPPSSVGTKLDPCLWMFLMFYV